LCAPPCFTGEVSTLTPVLGDGNLSRPHFTPASRLPRSRRFNPRGRGVAGAGHPLDLAARKVLEHRERELLRRPGHRDGAALLLARVERGLAVAGRGAVDARVDARHYVPARQQVAIVREHQVEEVVAGLV